MFTGIIQATGSIVSSTESSAGVHIELAGLPADWHVPIGGSVAVNGVCLTLVAYQDEKAWFDVGPETLSITGSETWQSGQVVNLEPALRMGDPLGGHMVSGHVDATAIVVSQKPVTEEQNSGMEFWIDLPQQILPYALPKGSIALDGISLTINEVTGTRIRVNLIPHTLERTAIHQRWLPGRKIHVEADAQVRQIAQAVEVYLATQSNHIPQTRD